MDTISIVWSTKKQNDYVKSCNKAKIIIMDLKQDYVLISSR